MTDSEFWVKIEAIDRMLSPITKAIGDLESDRTNLSRVYEIFQKLRYNQAIKYLVDERWAFLHTEPMGIAYLLNPATHGGEGFVGSDKIDSYESLKNYYQVTVISKITDKELARLESTAFLEEIDQYLAEMASANATSKLQDVSRNKEPLSFWVSWGSGFPRLQKIAISLFSTCTSAASAERIWSVFDFVHSKRRNRLANDKVERLVFIYSNSRRLLNNLSLIV